MNEELCVDPDCPMCAVARAELEQLQAEKLAAEAMELAPAMMTPAQVRQRAQRESDARGIAAESKFLPPTSLPDASLVEWAAEQQRQALIGMGVPESMLRGPSAEPPAWPPGPNHLADPVPGQPGRRPACGSYNGSFLGPDEFLSAPLGSLCVECNSLRIARGVELMQAGGYHRPRPPSAVASAPAARPRLTIFCQSEED